MRYPRFSAVHAHRNVRSFLPSASTRVRRAWSARDARIALCMKSPVPRKNGTGVPNAVMFLASPCVIQGCSRTKRDTRPHSSR